MSFLCRRTLWAQGEDQRLRQKIPENPEATSGCRFGSEVSNRSPGDQRHSQQEVGPGRPGINRSGLQETCWELPS